jgi:apolipoprotein N-acyltransferase
MDSIAPFVPTAGEDPLKHHRLPRGPEGGAPPSLFDDVTVPLVVGGHSYDPVRRAPADPYGSAAYILPASETDPDGRRVGLYHKNIRLAFGEALPFEEWLPRWVREQSPGRLEPGRDSPVFFLRGRSAGPAGAGPWRFRGLICYEAVLPGYVRRNAGGIDFFVNLSEDYWYGDSAHIRQHEAVLRLRCLENRVPLLRCTNVGPSGFVDAAGEFHEPTPSWAPARTVVGFRPGASFSFYREIGWVFPGLALAAGLVISLIYNNKKS